MLVAAMTAFTFTSCEDVPEAYETPGGGNGGGSTEMTGNGTAESPYTVRTSRSMAPLAAMSSLRLIS